MRTRRSTRSTAKSTLTRKAKVTKPKPKVGAKRKTPTNNVPKPTASPTSPNTKQDEKALKQQAKQRWQDWLARRALPLDQKLHTREPKRIDCITQTDCQKLHGLKPHELSSLQHTEKPHPVYGTLTKLFVEVEVRKLAVRKLAMLGGETQTGDGVGKEGESGEERDGSVSDGEREGGKVGAGGGPASRTRAQTKANQMEPDGGL
jgi:hypothetical protein